MSCAGLYQILHGSRLHSAEIAKRPAQRIQENIRQWGWSFSNVGRKARLVTITRPFMAAGHIHGLQRPLQPLHRMHTPSEATERTQQTDQVLFTLYIRRLTGICHNLPKILRRDIGGTVSPLPLEVTCLTNWMDHDALKWILYLTNSTVKLDRWQLRLSKMELNVIHFAVIKPQPTDA